MYGEIGSSPLFASGDSLTLVWIEGEPLKSLRPPILDAKERHHTWKQCRQVTIIIHTYRGVPPGHWKALFCTTQTQNATIIDFGEYGQCAPEYVKALDARERVVFLGSGDLGLIG